MSISNYRNLKTNTGKAKRGNDSRSTHSKGTTWVQTHQLKRINKENICQILSRYVVKNFDYRFGLVYGV